MPNPRYRIYLRETFQLAQTMVIHSRLMAEAVNKELETMGHFVGDDPRSWKYYKNLAGEYHETDTMMRVRSIDTLEMIDFTKENLTTNRNTRQEYQYGSRYYRELVEQYPEQEPLILGILHPVDINRAINAREGEILFYDTRYVNRQEHSLMHDLQDWIYAFFTRWSVDGYSITDELYAPAKLGVLFAHLPMALINIRLSKTGTLEAHDYHIREYLASHNRLDRYLDALSLQQKMYLYFNIRYIQRHPGQRQTFEQMMEWLMTRDNLPLAKYDVQHNDINLLTDSDLLPSIEMQRDSLNGIRSDSQSDSRSYGEVIERQYAVAPGNAQTDAENREQIVQTLRHSRFNRLPTKVLESSILDSSQAQTFSLDDDLLFHWPYLAFQGYYSASVTVGDPVTGESVQLDMKEAFLAYIYAFNKARGHELTSIPPFQVLGVQRIPRPSYASLYEVMEAELFTLDAAIEIQEEVDDSFPTIISTIEYQQRIRTINETKNRLRRSYMRLEDRDRRAMMEAAASRLYQSKVVSYRMGELYTDFFNEIGLSLHQADTNDLEFIANEILERATGVDQALTTPLQQRQSNILSIMSTLTSYSVHYLQSINEEDFWVFDTVALRQRTETERAFDHQYVHIGGIRSLSANSIPQREVDLIQEPVALDPLETEPPNYHYKWDIGIEYTPREDTLSKLDLRIGGIIIDPMEPYAGGEDQYGQGEVPDDINLIL